MTSLLWNKPGKTLDLLDKVLSSLGKRGVKIKLSKCQFAKPQIQFLGHLVSGDEYKLPKLRRK